MGPKTGKFADFDVSSSTPELWTPSHPIGTGSGFRCLRPEFGTYWRQGLNREVTTHMCRCWIISHNGALAAYITLLADRLSIERKKFLKTEGVKRDSFPAVKIGYLASDKRAQGAGSHLLEWSLSYIALTLSPAVGVRFVTVDALDDPDTGYSTVGYYEKYGFQVTSSRRTPKRPSRSMFMDIKPLIDLYGASLSDE